MSIYLFFEFFKIIILPDFLKPGLLQTFQEVIRQAREVAGKIDDTCSLSKTDRDEALAAIVVALTEAKDLKQAREVTDEIINPLAKVKALAAIAGVSGEINDFEQARAVADGIDDTYDKTPKSEAFLVIIKALAKVNDFK